MPCWKPAKSAYGAVLGFSTRRGGVSLAPFDSLNLGRSTVDEPLAVTENRARLLGALGLEADRLATAGQVHGIHVVEAAAPGHQSECDALLSSTPGLALAVTTADCMSLLFEAPGVVAAAHSGWRGAADGMPVAALEAVCARAACDPGRVHVHFGPCIRGCCYEVGEEVAARFPAAALRREGAKPKLDLPTATRLALVKAGIPDGQLHDTGACTYCEPYWYFSHRRDEGRTGRLWGVAALPTTPVAGR
ncbi:MAG: polyphenol oxidase family protein [Candidatus Eisenbacteria bacterium]